MHNTLGNFDFVHCDFILSVERYKLVAYLLYLLGKRLRPTAFLENIVNHLTIPPLPTENITHPKVFVLNPASQMQK